jgi:hypothetical protein
MTHLAYLLRLRKNARQKRPAHRPLTAGVGIVNGIFQLRLERCVDDPLADLRAGFCKLGDIINIRFIQQVVNALVYTALVQKQVKRIGGRCKPFGTEHPYLTG